MQRADGRGPEGGDRQDPLQEHGEEDEAAHFTPSGILAKNEMISRMIASRLTTMAPKLWMLMPSAPSKPDRRRRCDLLSESPPSTKCSTPNKAKAMAAAWTTTRPAMVRPRIL